MRLLMEAVKMEGTNISPTTIMVDSGRAQGFGNNSGNETNGTACCDELSRIRSPRMTLRARELSEIRRQWLDIGIGYMKFFSATTLFLPRDIFHPLQLSNGTL